MKRITKRLLAVMLMYVSSFSCFAQTTMEEYNYVTKGYKSQVIEQGGDIKSGYSMIKMGENQIYGSREAQLFYLKKNSTNTIAAYMIFYKNEDSGFEDYICIPYYNSEQEIHEAYLMKLKDYSVEALLLINWVMGQNLRR